MEKPVLFRYVYYTQISDREADLLSDMEIWSKIYKAIQISTDEYIGMNIRRNKGGNDNLNYLELEMSINTNITLVYTIIRDYFLTLTSPKQ